MLASHILLWKNLGLPEFLGMLYVVKSCLIGYVKLSGFLSAQTWRCKEEVGWDF